jgi:hypothetical protein
LRLFKPPRAGRFFFIPSPRAKPAHLRLFLPLFSFSHPADMIPAADARAFFTLPLPHLVWERSKQPRNPRFVQFIEDALASYA